MSTETKSTSNIVDLPSAELKLFLDELIAKHGHKADIDSSAYVSELVRAVNKFRGPIDEALQQRRDFHAQLQKSPKSQFLLDHIQFLESIGYIESKLSGETCQTDLSTVDKEIASIAGPQLVVPLTNARYALNAANSRWMSLYDSIYASNIPDDQAGDRAKNVVTFVMEKLDEWFPLRVDDWSTCNLEFSRMHYEAALKDPEQFYGVSPCQKKIYLKHHGLLCELTYDPAHKLASLVSNGICDVSLESAITAIMDGEDSVSAVDEEDKMLLYSNWLGLMDKSLSSSFMKGGKEVTRTLKPDKTVLTKGGEQAVLPGRALLLTRCAGLHIFTDIIGDNCETVVDVFVYGLIAYLVDVLGDRSNSKMGSVYLVIPKMHGSREVALLTQIMAAAEDAMKAPRNTLKIGIMDEERRTSLNLMNCVQAAKERVCFINTGFLDRTGDQISSLSALGPVPGKADMKKADWLKTYEARNVSVGLAFGLHGRAQIGKGMWPAPDALKEMMTEKVGHVTSGASTAWVPSPTGAAIHAMHYHDHDVQAIMGRKKGEAFVQHEGLCAAFFLSDEAKAKMTTPTSPFDLDDPRAIEDPVIGEVLNDVQCIVGYASRWIILGMGCSKIPNMQGVGLMEDRATLRISSQHLANWLQHGIISEELVLAAVQNISAKIDETNKDEVGWVPILSAGEDTPAMGAIKELCLEGLKMENGYTEPTLYKYRRTMKKSAKL